MQKIAQFIRNISLTLHQLKHYCFHTSNKTYFLQTTPFLMQLRRKSDFCTYEGATHGRAPNQLTYHGPPVETCASQNPSDGLANPPFYTSLGSVTHSTINGIVLMLTSSPLRWRRKRGALHQNLYTSCKSTDKASGQKCQHNFAGRGKHLYQIRDILSVSIAKWNKVWSFPVTE